MLRLLLEIRLNGITLVYQEESEFCCIFFRKHGENLFLFVFPLFPSFCNKYTLQLKRKNKKRTELLEFCNKVHLLALLL
jgi:hypothetical protein